MDVQGESGSLCGTFSIEMFFIYFAFSQIAILHVQQFCFPKQSVPSSHINPNNCSGDRPVGVKASY